MANPTPVVAVSVDQSPGVAADVDVTTGTAIDATNGNSTPNNGAVRLLVTSAAADTVIIVRPEEPDDSRAFLANKKRLIGPFEPDLYGDPLVWHGAATTTVVAIQFPDNP